VNNTLSVLAAGLLTMANCCSRTVYMTVIAIWQA